MPRGREIQLHPTVERFAKDMERVRREQERELTDLGFKPSTFSQTYLLGRLMDKFKVLVEVVNESKSHSEVVKYAAVVADAARAIAAVEYDSAEGESDVRGLPEEF